MYNRVVVPILDEKQESVLGWTGRSIYERCDKCKLWHHPEKRCPASLEEIKLCCKWKNDSNTNISYYLYNLWNVKNAETIILVEGPPDVWKLVEAGIKNVVALFGVNLTDRQKILLERNGIMNLVVLLDNDEAGQRGIATIKEECSRQYNIYYPKILSKDPGDMTIDEINTQIKPFLEKIK